MLLNHAPSRPCSFSMMKARLTLAACPILARTSPQWRSVIRDEQLLAGKTDTFQDAVAAQNGVGMVLNERARSSTSSRCVSRPDREVAARDLSHDALQVTIGLTTAAPARTKPED